jgi:chromate transporter
MIYVYLFLEFFKTGLLAVGGGLATIPFLYEIALNYGWFSEQELVDMLAISESTPGPLGVNMATYAGFSAAGILGGIAATFALVLPSVIIILIVAKFMNRYGESRIASGAFWALRPAATGIIAGALFLLLTLTLRINSEFNIPSAVMYTVLAVAGLFAEAKKIKMHPFVFICVGAVMGIILNIAQ